MARIVFGDGWWLDVQEDAATVRSAIHSALVPDRLDGLYVGPKLVTVAPDKNEPPVYVNPARVVMVVDVGEAS